MKKVTKSLAILFLFACMAASSPVSAQINDNTTSNNTTDMNEHDSDDDYGKWGLAGLLGLLGLAGLKKNDDRIRTNVNR